MNSKTSFVLAFIIIASALLGFSTLTRGHVWGDDWAAYTMQAKSILAWDMDAFVDRNSFTVTQSSMKTGHQMGPAAYPWGFPLILVPAYLVRGIHPLGLKLPGLAAYLAFLLTFYILTRRRFTFTESLLAVSLFAFNPELLHFLDNILSDIPFLFFSTFSLLVADIYIQETNHRRKRIMAALTGLAFFAAFFVRTQGLLLLGSLILYQGFRFLKQRDQRKQLTTDLLILSTSFGLLWGIASFILPSGQSSYLELYSDFTFSVFQGNLLSYSNLFREFFATLPAQFPVFSFFIVLFFSGIIVRFKQDLLFILYTVLYMFVLWTWPDWQGYRMLFPMLPLFIYFSFQGVRFLTALLPSKSASRVGKLVYTMLIILVFLFLITASKNAITNLGEGRNINGPFDPYSMEIYEFIKNETPVGSVIVFFKPRAMRLMTDRDSLALTECDRMSEGDYLALSKKVGENLQIPPERIGECSLQLGKVFENKRFVIFQIKK